MGGGEGRPDTGLGANAEASNVAAEMLLLAEAKAQHAVKAFAGHPEPVVLHCDLPGRPGAALAWSRQGRTKNENPLKSTEGGGAAVGGHGMAGSEGIGGRGNSEKALEVRKSGQLEKEKGAT